MPNLHILIRNNQIGHIQYLEDIENLSFKLLEFLSDKGLDRSLKIKSILTTTKIKYEEFDYLSKRSKKLFLRLINQFSRLNKENYYRLPQGCFPLSIIKPITNKRPKWISVKDFDKENLEYFKNKMNRIMK